MDLILEKTSVVKILEEIATLLDLAGENPFKSRAYSNAARALETTAESLSDLLVEGRLGEMKGIGKALEEKIHTLATTGRLEYHEDLKSQFPTTLFDLLRVPNLGPKKVKVLYSDLKIQSLDQLEVACREGKVRELPGFGTKTEKNILEGIERVKTYSARVLLPLAEETAIPLLDLLKSHPDTIRCSLCGSLRRRLETIKDIDLLVSSSNPAAIVESFTSFQSVARVTGHGETKASVVLQNGMAADLRVVNDEEFPFALNYFTGSKIHNTLMRGRAKDRGLRLNEYAFTREDGNQVHCKDEEEIYRTLGLSYIPPELREGLGEIEWAETGRIPQLAGYDCLHGTLHCHTTASDGKGTLREMAAAAQAMGYEYLGIGDHSKSAFYANGLDEKRLARQWEEIDKYNQMVGWGLPHRGERSYRNEMPSRNHNGGASERSYRNEMPSRNHNGGASPTLPVLLKGTEVDILKDGSLDFAEEILRECDYAVASVHTLLNLDENSMTARLIRAIESPGVTFLGHLTGRLLLQREPSPFNMAKVLDATARNGKWIEINSNPYRLDMDWRTCLEARDRGILFCINPDAHDCEGLKDNRYGIDVARKGGLSEQDLANSRPLAEFLNLLARTRGSG